MKAISCTTIHFLLIALLAQNGSLKLNFRALLRHKNQPLERPKLTHPPVCVIVDLSLS
jgi:hypothetical protein